MADPKQPDEAADELDPELVKLGRKPRSTGPVLALSIVVFCIYMMVQLRADLRFSRQGDAPTAIPDASEMITRATDDSFVRVPLRPDRSFAMRVRKGKAKAGHRVTPVLGTNETLWLVEGGTPWDATSVYDTVYAGRLRRLSDMPFRDALAAYVKKAAARPRYVPFASIRTALAKKSDTVRHAAGDNIAVTGATPVRVAETVVNTATVRAFRTARHPDAEAWSAALIAAGIAESLPTPSVDKNTLVYVVDAPEGIDAVKAKLVKAKLFMGRVEPIKRAHTTTWDQLSQSDDGLKVGAMTVPWRNISAVSLEVPRRLPANAWVLIANEQPSSYWYLLPLYVVFALFAALFLWAFARGLRRGRPIPL